MRLPHPFESQRFDLISDPITVISYTSFADTDQDGSSPKNQHKPEKVKNEPADFETAISATGFGKFNFLILLVTFPSIMASSFDTTTMAFVVPVAQCDLELTLLRKGSLTGAIYFGMITTPFLWGFLADTLGRKKMMTLGFALSASCDLCIAFATNYWALLVLKYLNGCSICGPYAILMSYLSEVHGQNFRSKIVIFSGFCFSSVNIILPIIAWFILPQAINIAVIDNFLVFHSYNVFLFVAAFPPIIAGISFLFFPESPKFLMAMGKNDEALEVFRLIYSMNTGEPPEHYPITRLKDETEVSLEVKRESLITIKSFTDTFATKLRNGWHQIKPLFSQPHVSKVGLVFTIQFSSLMGVNTLRLWLPQLYTMIETFVVKHPNESSDICTIIASSTSSSTIGSNLTDFHVRCEPDTMEDSMFQNFIIMGFFQGFLYFVAGTIIKPFGKKSLMISSFMFAGIAGSLMYFADSENYVLITSSVYVGMLSVASTTIVAVALDLVPTSLRTTTVSLLMMCGRSGSLSGNLIFPILLQTGCLPPFLLIGGTTLVCGLFSLMLPKATSS